MSAEQGTEQRVAELLASVGRGLDKMASDMARMALLLNSAAEAIARADAAKAAYDAGRASS